MTKQMPETIVIDGVEVSRRFVQEATTMGRQTAEYNMNMSRQMAELWTASVEANLKAAFELQNAAIAASRSLITATGGNQTIIQQWTDMVQQAQKATLEAWQAGKRLGEQFQSSK